MNPFHYGAVVGISQYPGVSDLAGPVLDAQSFRDWLLEGGAVPEANVHTLTTPAADPPPADPFDARPIKREVDRMLELINTKARDDVADDPDRWSASRLYLYVAGHGIMPSAGDTALLLADARKGVYENIEMRAYLDWYKRAGIFSELVVFADCCRNWFGQVDPSVVPFSKAAQPAAQVFAMAGYAAGPGDPAYERIEEGVPPDERRGYFTSAVLEGLRGAAAVDPAHHAITSSTLATYVKFTVESATAGKRVPQQVEMPSDPAHPILLASPAAEPTYPVTIRFPDGWRQPVELLLRDGSRQAYSGAPAPWGLSLPAGLYAVVLPHTFDDSPFPSGGRFFVTERRDVQL